MQIQLSPRENNSDDHRATDVDDHGENEIRDANDLMKDTPRSLTTKWKFSDTNETISFIQDGEWSGEDEFVRSWEDNDGTCDNDEATSDMRLLDPLFGDEDRRIDALKSNECSQPERSASETSQREVSTQREISRLVRFLAG